MMFSDETVADVTKRLRRANGQVNAVERMLAEDSDCREVVTQLTAAIKALDQAAFKLIASGLEYCIENPKQAKKAGYVLEDVEKLFLRLG